jgi:hypothetical protein
MRDAPVSGILYVISPADWLCWQEMGGALLVTGKFSASSQVTLKATLPVWRY